MNKYFLSKNNELAFEMENQYIDWKNFLLHIDNKKSTQNILDELSINYAAIKEFLQLAINEKILVIGSSEKEIIKAA